MNLKLRYKVSFKDVIPRLELITKKINSHSTLEIKSEENILQSLDYLEGARTYLFYGDLFEDMVEVILIEKDEIHEMHLWSDKGENSITELVLSVLISEGGTITYNNYNKTSGMFSWFCK